MRIWRLDVAPLQQQQQPVKDSRPLSCPSVVETASSPALSEQPPLQRHVSVTFM